MTWFKVDDSIVDHPKFLDLASGPCEAKAVLLWVKAGAWCSRHLTDGFVPKSAVRALVSFNPRREIDELVRVSLWEVREKGWQFHDWHQRQPSKEDVIERREKTRIRVQEYRGRNAVTDLLQVESVTQGVTLLPARPVPSELQNLPTSAKPKLGESEARRVFEHWVASRGKDPSRTKLTPDRTAKVKARLRDGYPVEDMLAAIDGIALSPYHMGENATGTMYDDLELILRDGKHLERFRDLSKRGPALGKVRDGDLVT